MREDFNRNWYVKKHGADEWKKVNLPHDAMITEKRDENCHNAVNTGFYPGGKYLYRKTFQIPKEYLGKYVALFFEGVYRCASVCVNGKFLHQEIYGYNEFEVDISCVIKFGENVVEVDVDNSLEPNSRWYTGSGIYRPVYMIVKENDRLTDITITTKSINPAIINVSCNIDANVHIYEGNNLIAAGKCGDIEIPNAKLWSDETPALYKAVLQTKTDAEELLFGIRTIEYAAATGLLVNGKEVKLRGACIHHDNGILGACEYQDAAQRRIRILKEQGYNAIRSAHNPCSREILDACDKYGIYVIDEVYDGWFIQKTYHDSSRDFFENYVHDTEVMINKDKNHPSVIMYSIGNENTEIAVDKGIEYAKKMTELIKKLDPSRIVTIGANLAVLIMNVFYQDEPDYKREPLPANSKKDFASKVQGSQAFNLIMGIIPLIGKLAGTKKCEPFADKLASIVDIVGLNYGTTRYKGDLKRVPERMYIGSETMIGSLYENWQYVKNNHQIIGDFIWTGWDYIGEAGTCGVYEYVKWPGLSLLGGAGTIDITGNPTAANYYSQIIYGTYKNAYIAVSPASYTGEKAIKGPWRRNNHIRSWSWNGFEKCKVKIDVYGLGESAELFLNGKSLGKKRIKKGIAEFHTKYIPGTLNAKVYNSDGSIWGEDQITTAGKGNRLQVETDKCILSANGQDLCFVDINLTDKAGILKPAYDTEVSVEVIGDAVELAALGSARSKTDEYYNQTHHQTHFGHVQAILRAGYKPGAATIRVNAEGYVTNEFVVNVR